MPETATISSVALPKVAFNKPPILSFVCKATCSVTNPSRSANGASPNNAKTNVTPSGQPTPHEIKDIGMQINRMLSGPVKSLNRDRDNKGEIKIRIIISTTGRGSPFI